LGNLIVKSDNFAFFAYRALETKGKNEVPTLAKAIRMSISLRDIFESRLLNRKPKL
jgi:hypothetical protein